MSGSDLKFKSVIFKSAGSFIQGKPTEYKNRNLKNQLQRKFFDEKFKSICMFSHKSPI
jgi:hypothetical protein